MTIRPHFIADYEVVASLGAGGMAEVFLARKRGAYGFERLVAVKVLRSPGGQDDATRLAFLDEARLLGRLAHPAIAGVSDFGEADGVLYLVLEYVSGVSLAELLRYGPLPPRAAVQLFASVCYGLHEAHELRDSAGYPLGVVHRDVSPQNILVSFAGAPKLVDFGIALTTQRTQPVTEFGRVKGKPSYMAPEQWRNEPIDRRADVFAVGVVMYEALTGHRLFTGDSAYAIGMQVCDKQILSPSSICLSIPAAVDSAVARALDRVVEARYPTAMAMAKELDAVALNLDGVTLKAYVTRVLAAARASHDEFLAGIETSGASPNGRPDGVQTVDTVDGGPRSSRRLHRWRVPLASVCAALITLFAVGSQVEDVGYEAVIDIDVDGLDSLNRRSDEAGHSAIVATETTSAGADGPRATGTVEMVVRASEPAVQQSAGSGSRRPRTHRKRSKLPQRLVEPEPPPAGRATLVVLAEPYAVILLDGRNEGPTPNLSLETTAGEHVIQLIHPVDGSVRHAERVSLVDGQTRRIRAPEMSP